MNAAKKRVQIRQIQTTMENLRKNRMEAYYVKTAADVPAQVETLLHEGDVVAVGGSITLGVAGALSLLGCG